jgi:hypothetical protein
MDEDTENETMQERGEVGNGAHPGIAGELGELGEEQDKVEDVGVVPEVMAASCCG